MKLVAVNYFAANDLFSIVAENKGLLWMSKAAKEAQKENFIKPHLFSAKLNTLLCKVDVEKLTQDEKAVYSAFLNNGPVRYIHTESLMAIFCSDIASKEYSDQMLAFYNKLPKNSR